RSEVELVLQVCATLGQRVAWYTGLGGQSDDRCAAGVLTGVSPASDTDTAGRLDRGLAQRALREVHGRLDDLTTLVTEQLTTAAQPGQAEWSAVRSIVSQSVEELRREPHPAAHDTGEDNGGSDGGTRSVKFPWSDT
ncbi:hypothetical protein, partial [Streptomyces sp. ISL-100]|uniref:hypothetical protein n=1 Tax=Streptomyces sp. ISL-100 TaxID=2819173 RepID=UPI001C1DBD6C|nr:hypothetical protein [Streptomyces sp. ISL-100]